MKANLSIFRVRIQIFNFLFPFPVLKLFYTTKQETELLKNFDEKNRQYVPTLSLKKFLELFFTDTGAAELGGQGGHLPTQFLENKIETSKCSNFQSI